MQDVATELAALDRMSTGDLAERYRELHGQPCRTRHRAYLVRKVAWRIQANAEGDLTERARRRAAELADDAEIRVMAPKTMVCPPQVGETVTITRPMPAEEERPNDPRMPPPGTALVRQYKGRTIRAVVLEDGHPGAHRPQVGECSMTTVTKQIHFAIHHRRKVAMPGLAPDTRGPEGRVPRVARLMALAIRFDRLLADGVVGDLTELARLAHVTQPRMTQIMNLLHLAPDIQEVILCLSPIGAGRDAVTERDLRPITRLQDWRMQRIIWEKLGSS